MAPKQKPKKPAKTAATADGRELYVGLIESEAMQRELLEARKNALVLLKRFEKLVLLREQRLYVEGELKSSILELSKQIDGVMSSLPELPAEKQAAPRAAKSAPKSAPKPGPHAMSEIDRKLADIDARLADLEK